MSRVFIVGWDGATFDLIKPWVAEGKLPHIAEVLENGAHGLLRSTLPPMTFPAWTSFMTGKNPAKHGIFDPRLGKWVYGDKIDARFGFLDENSATHYGEKVEWLLFTPFMNIESASIDEMGIEILPGHTVSDNAMVFFSMTYDGVTFGQRL